MKRKTFPLFTKTGKRIGTVTILDVRRNVYIGKINFLDFPRDLRKLFTEYEQSVNDQLFSSLDDLEEQINFWGLRLEHNTIYDIQLMNTNDFSFKSTIPIDFDVDKSLE